MDEEEICVLLENDEFKGAFASFERAKEKMEEIIKDKKADGWKLEDDYDESDMTVELYHEPNVSKFYCTLQIIQTMLYY